MEAKKRTLKDNTQLIKNLLLLLLFEMVTFCTKPTIQCDCLAGGFVFLVISTQDLY